MFIKTSYTIPTKFKLDKVQEILEKQFDLCANDLIYTHKAVGHPIIGNMAIMNCSIKAENQIVQLNIKFRIHWVFYIALTISILFSSFSILFYIFSNDIMQLVGLVPLFTIIPIIIIIFLIDKGNKMNKLITTFSHGLY